MTTNKKTITPDTKVADLLNDYPQLETLLQQFSPAFSALKNPILRRTVAKVTSLQQAAKVGNVSVVEMVNSLRKEAGLSPLEEAFCPDSAVATPVTHSNRAPETPVTFTLDVRPIIERGDHPKEEVLAQAGKLQSGDCMEFIAPFPPIPLIDLLKSRGFRVTMLAPENGAVRTFVER